MPNDKNPKYDLEERTAKFGEDILKFANKIPRNPVTIPLIVQLVKARTSIGANYCEADDAESSKDFQHKIGICKKESRESKHWLRLIVVVISELPELVEEARKLWKEANELNLIFNSIIIKIRNKNSKIEKI